MLVRERGFTVIQFITGMTVVGLLLMGVFVAVAKQVDRDNQRRADLVVIDAMIQRLAENDHGRYPNASDVANPGSDLRQEYDRLRLEDPKSETMYPMGTDFSDCGNKELGAGYVSYGRPGDNAPYKLRICLERGEYYIGR